MFSRHFFHVSNFKRSAVVEETTARQSWPSFCSLLVLVPSLLFNLKTSMEENQQPWKRFNMGQLKKALILWDTYYADDRNGLIAALKREHGIKVSTSTLTDWKKRKFEYLACPADD